MKQRLQIQGNGLTSQGSVFGLKVLFYAKQENLNMGVLKIEEMKIAFGANGATHQNL